MSEKDAQQNFADDVTLAADASGTTTPGRPITETAMTGEVLSGRWRLVGMLGAGGMGTVYRARDPELDEDVALKVLHASLANADAVERFRREVKLARKVTHKNVARVHELGEHDGKRFFTMELVEGESLRHRLDRAGALSLRDTVDIGIAIARGLAAAHEVGVVHRDLKPDNVLLGEGGRVAITDFGIASSLSPGSSAVTSSFIGTPMYMAPEQVDRQSPIDERSDIYAAGAVLYEMLTGDPPFRGETPLAIAVARLREGPPDPRVRRPSVPPALAALVCRCMARNAADRVASAAMLERELVEAMTFASSSATGPLAPEPLPRPSPFAALANMPAPRSVLTFGTSIMNPAAATRVAVLPLAHGGEERDKFLAEGLTDDLIDGLSTIRNLQVLSRSVVARYGGRRDVDPRTVGSELGVDVVAEGALRRASADGLRLSLRLISASDGLQLWTKRFDLADAELLTVSEAAAGAIAEALTVEGPRGHRKLRHPHAIELYLRARGAYWEFSPEGSMRSIELLDQALALEPDDALLVSARAIALARFGFFRGDRQGDAIAAAARAVELAPDSGEANLAMGVAHMQCGRMAEALRWTLQAITYAPSLGEAYQTAAKILSESGPLELAKHFLETAANLDGMHGMTKLDTVRVLCLMHRWEEARAGVAALATSTIEPLSRQLGRARVAMWLRDEPELIATCAEIRALAIEMEASSPSRAVIANRLSSFFDPKNPVPTPEEIRFALTFPSQSARRDSFVLQIMTESAAYRGSTEVAVDILKQAVDAGLHDECWLARCPLLEDVRRSPRAAPLVAVIAERAAAVRAGLPPRLLQMR